MFWKILLAGISIPLITPLVVHLYLEFIPGVKIGSIDGWLSYLGGYSGGFLAFLAAYFIFENERKERNRTTVIVESLITTQEEVSAAMYHVYFSEGPHDKFKVERNGRVVGVDDYHVIRAQLKNISPVYARKIDLLVGAKNLKPLIYRKGFQPSVYDSMAELEIGGTFEFVLHLDPDLWDSSRKLNCKLESYNLRGDKFEQSVVIHQSFTGGMTFEMES